MVVVTSILLACKSSEQNWPADMLENVLLIELGDFSYVLYLVHWPIIKFCLYWSPHGVIRFIGEQFLLKRIFRKSYALFSDGVAITALVLTVAMLVDQIDAQFRQLANFRSIILLICCLYAICFRLIFHDEIRFGNDKVRQKKKQAVQWSTFARLDTCDRVAFYCFEKSYTKLKGRGNYFRW